MTLTEAYEKLKTQYPGRNVAAWNWIPEDGRVRFSIDVDNGSSHEESFERCFETLKAPTREEIAAGKRLAAQKLIDEAEALLAMANQLAPTPKASEAVES